MCWVCPWQQLLSLQSRAIVTSKSLKCQTFVRSFQHDTPSSIPAHPSVFVQSLFPYPPTPHIVSKHLKCSPWFAPLAAEPLQSGFQLFLFGSKFVPLGLQSVALVLQAVDAVSGLLQDHHLGRLVVVRQLGYVVAQTHEAVLQLVAPLPLHYVVRPPPLLLVFRLRRVPRRVVMVPRRGGGRRRRRRRAARRVVEAHRAVAPSRALIG